MRLFELLSTKYSKFDSTMNAFLEKAFSGFGQKYAVSNVYGMILTAIKGVMQNIMFYIEDAMTEQNVFTAIRKKSVYSLARISGYEAYYGSPAVGTVKISTKITNSLESGSTKIILPNKTPILNSSTGYRYLMMLSNDYIVIDMTKPLIQEDIKIVQGKETTATYQAVGSKLESFNIFIGSSLISQDYIDVYVNNVKWSIEHNIYDMVENAESCVVTTGYDGNLSIIFGDGVHGKQLNEGDTIMVSYISHDGENGNIAMTDTPKFKFQNNLQDGLGTDINGNEYIDIALSNYITGGSNSDSISLVRNMIGCQSRSLVISSDDNFKLFLSRFSFISVANIVSYEKSLTITISPVANLKQLAGNNLTYLTCPTSTLMLTDYQKNMILTSLENSKKMFAGLSVQIIDPIIRKYAIVCYVKSESDYLQEKIKTAIQDNLVEYFTSIPYNTQFIAKSDLIKKVVDNVSGIISFDLTIISNDDEEAKSVGYWYKYTTKQVNKSISIMPVRETYDNNEPVGLDVYGNIKLDTLLEMPLLHDGVKVYIEGENSTVTIRNGIEVNFI